MFTVTAIAVDGGTKVSEVRNADLEVQQVVWADAASSSSLSGSAVELDPALNGEAKAETRIIITAPQLTATKTAVVLDEGLGTFDCETGTGTATPATAPRAPIPGACVEYTITVENDTNASAAAADITIIDALPTGTTYEGKTDGDFTSVTESSGTVTATLTTLAAGDSASFTIRVTVD